MLDELFNKCKLDSCSRGPIVTDKDTGEILCASCGQVLIEKMTSIEPETRSFGLEQFSEKSRTGIKSSLAIHDMGLTTIIGITNKDASGKNLSGYMRNTFGRLRVWDQRSKAKPRDRNMAYAFTLLNGMKSKLTLPDYVIEDTAYIYRKALAAKTIRGRSIASMLYTALYVACRNNNIPRSLRDIAKAGNLGRGDLAITYRIMMRKLDLKVEPYDPAEFVLRICNMIGTSEKTRRIASNLVLKAGDAKFSSGKNPMCLVAAAVYLACEISGEDKTQVEIARVCGISNVSVRNVCRLFRQKLDPLIRQEQAKTHQIR
jgi:transcription initiation factor TFIIB